MSMELKTAIDLIESCRDEAIEAETAMEDELEAWQYLIDTDQVPNRWRNTAERPDAGTGEQVPPLIVLEDSGLSKL